MDQNKELVMFSFNVRRVFSATIMVSVLSCLTLPCGMAAASPDKGAAITFTATGTFAGTPVSGADTLKLAGQPFTIVVVGNTSMIPVKHGQNWAVFTPLQMTGTVYSGLTPNVPIPIASTTAAIDQTVGATEDIFQSGFPIVVIGISLNVKAHLPLPGGTLSKALLRPFASVALDTTDTVTYSNATAATVLAIQDGTLVATVPGGGPERASLTAQPSVEWLTGALALKPRGMPAIRL
jgi:hypothetical protein